MSILTQTTAFAEDAVPPAPAWKISLLNELYVNDAELRAQPGSHKTTSYTEPKFSYKYTPTLAYEFSTPFEVNQVKDSTQKANNVNEELAGKTFSGARLSNIWAGISLKSQGFWSADDLVIWVRFYFPTSELDKAKMNNGMLRMDLQVPWTIGKWNFLYLLNPRLNLSHDESTNRQSQLSFRQYAIATYNFTEAFSAYGSYGNKLNSTSNNFLHNNSVVNAFETGATYVFNPTINLTFYVTNEFLQGTDSIKLLSPAKNDMALSTAISF